MASVPEAPTWASSWLAPLDSTQAANVTLYLLVIAAVIAFYQIIVANKTKEINKHLSIYQSLFSHNNEIIKNEKMKIAVEVFLSLNDGKASSQFYYVDEYFDFYWAARAIHLGHMTILGQVWFLSGKPRRMRRDFKRWENFALAVVKDLNGQTLEGKPTWYQNACTDFWKSIEKDEAFPPRFMKWIARILKEDEKRRRGKKWTWMKS